MLLQLCSQTAAAELLGKRRVRRHQEENRNYKREASVHLASDTGCLLQQISQMASILYTRKYYSDFLLREHDPSPIRRYFPASLQYDTYL